MYIHCTARSVRLTHLYPHCPDHELIQIGFDWLPSCSSCRCIGAFEQVAIITLFWTMWKVIRVSLRGSRDTVTWHWACHGGHVTCCSHCRALCLYRPQPAITDHVLLISMICEELVSLSCSSRLDSELLSFKSGKMDCSCIASGAQYSSGSLYVDTTVPLKLQIL